MALFILLLLFVGIAVCLTWFLVAHDRGEKEPIGMLWIAAALGLVGAIAASFIEGSFLDAKDLQPLVGLPTLAGSALAIGVIEESCKFIPLALLLYRKRYFNEHTDGVIYFALAGLGFGVPENILYTLQFGASAGIGRVILTPFFHAAITAIVGYFLVKRKLAGLTPWGIIVPLGVAMILHGLYDFGLSSGRAPFAILSVAIAMGLSTALFVLYVRASDMDQDRGLSAVGHNSFCRSCGFPNPKHHLYCIHCGKHA